MKFTPFSELYQHLKGTDQKLHTTLDKVSDNFKTLFNQSSSSKVEPVPLVILIILPTVANALVIGSRFS